MSLHKRQYIKILTAISFFSCLYFLWHVRTGAVIKMDYIWPYHLVVIGLGLIMTAGLKKDQDEIGPLIGVVLLLLTFSPFIYFGATGYLLNLMKNSKYNGEIVFVTLWCIFLSSEFIYFCILRTAIDKFIRNKS